MTNPLQTIPNLPPAVGLAGPEQLWINQAGVDRRTTLEDIGQFFTLGEYLPIEGGTLTGSLTINGNLITEGNTYAGANFIVNVAPPNANGLGMMWDNSGAWREYVTNNYHFITGPNGSCYMDANGNFYSTAALGASASGGVTIGQWKLNLDGSNNLNIYNTGGVSVCSIANSNGVFNAPYGSNIGGDTTIGHAIYWGSSGWYDYETNNARAIGNNNGGVLFTFDATGAISAVGSIYASPYFYAAGGAGSYRGMYINTSGSGPRWLVGANSVAETGSNSGSSFGIWNYSDTGTIIEAVLSILRSTGVCTFSQPIVNGSDARQKRDITPISDALALVKRLAGVSYERTSRPGKRELGLVAQDVRAIVPEVVEECPEAEMEGVTPIGTPEEPLLGISYTQFTALLVEAVKALTEQNDKLVARLEALEAKVA